MADIESLGKYEVRREIGRGAMGVVYEGYDPLIKRVVALKTIRPDPLTGEASAAVVARFRREAQAAGRLNHPNIVSIYDYGEDGAVWYIAMEYVNGRELKELFEANERFRIADIVRIMTQILNALDYSHRQGVIHRDVKPANIFLLPDGTVKVADFGIAHIDSSNLTQVGTVLGTPSYMSPEQIMGLPVDGRTDLFSAGVILYQFLTGERPFAGSATTTMQKVLKEDPLPPSMLNVQVLPAMDAVVRKALAKRADDRYQTAQEFADAIRTSAAAMTTSAAETTGPRQFGSDGSRSSRPTARQGNRARRQVRSGNYRGCSCGNARIADKQGTEPGARDRHRGGCDRGWRRCLVLLPAADRGRQARPHKRRRCRQQPHLHRRRPRLRPLPAHRPPEPGTMVISAVGLVDPSDPRYQNDKELLQSDLRADSRSQAVAKALGLLLDTGSLAKNYELLRDRLLSQSGSFIKTVVRESAPHTGKDGLVSITTDAVVNVKAVQKSLNQMSRDERIELIRANGDPKVSVADHGARRRPAGHCAPALPDRRKHPQGADQDVRFSYVVGRRPGRRQGRRFRGDRRGEGQEAFRATGSIRRRRDQVHADLVDRQVHRSRHGRGNLLQQHAAQGRRQLGERGRGAEGDRREDRRRVLARLLSPACERDGPEDNARDRGNAGRRVGGGTRARADRTARSDQRRRRRPKAGRAVSICCSPGAARRAISSRAVS